MLKQFIVVFASDSILRYMSYFCLYVKKKSALDCGKYGTQLTTNKWVNFALQGIKNSKSYEALLAAGKIPFPQPQTQLLEA